MKKDLHTCTGDCISYRCIINYLMKCLLEAVTSHLSNMFGFEVINGQKLIFVVAIKCC